MRPPNRLLVPSLVAATTLAVAACAPEPLVYRVYEPMVAVPERVEYGVVEAIEWFKAGDSRPVGLGAVIGGVAGGVLGHQIGHGAGNTAATIAGALGGAYVGNELERSSERDRYRVIVRLDDGGTLAVSEVGEGQLRVGDRVRIIGHRVYRV